MKRYFVYILRCRDGSYYTGVTNNVEKRVYEHRQGFIKGCYTHNKRPLELVYAVGFSQILDAIRIEKQIKGWSRKKKEALIAVDYKRLPELSMNYTLKKGHPSTGSG